MSAKTINNINTINTSAYPPALDTEPAVWRNLSQAQLDWAYDQVHHAPNRVEVLENIALKSARSRALVRAPQRLSYGSKDSEQLDWYAHESNSHAPIVFFVHGGAWKSGSAKDNALLVHWVMAQGCSVVIPDFDPVTSLKGDLSEMASQVQKALLYTYHHANTHHASPQHIIVVGHSSGAHLSACMVTRNWASLGLAQNPVSALLCCSGMYELEPVSLSARSRYVQFTPQMVQDLSPMRELSAFQMPVTLLCGDQESPEFIRQFEDFKNALKGHPQPLQTHWVEGLNHFEMLETLFDENSVHANALLDLIQRVRSNAALP